MIRDEQTRLSYWFPLIEAAGLPVPKTRIINIDDNDDLARIAYGEPSRSLAPLAEQIRTAALEVGGPPFFLRTDYTSGKHDWKDTCFVTELSLVEHHVVNLVEFSECVDLIGLPTDVWVVREMLNTQPLFRAFRGDMPITREFRYFVRDGEIEHVQSYWPEAALENHVNMPEGCTNILWREMLTVASYLYDKERAVLDDLTRKASAAVPGYFSVDWLETVDRGFVLIDMAEGDKSVLSAHAARCPKCR